jgi:hypothetical protein
MAKRRKSIWKQGTEKPIEWNGRFGDGSVGIPGKQSYKDSAFGKYNQLQEIADSHVNLTGAEQQGLAVQIGLVYSEAYQKKIADKKGMDYTDPNVQAQILRETANRPFKKGATLFGPEFPQDLIPQTVGDAERLLARSYTYDILNVATAKNYNEDDALDVVLEMNKSAMEAARSYVPDKSDWFTYIHNVLGVSSNNKNLERSSMEGMALPLNEEIAYHNPNETLLSHAHDPAYIEWDPEDLGDYLDLQANPVDLDNNYIPGAVRRPDEENRNLMNELGVEGRLRGAEIGETGVYEGEAAGVVVPWQYDIEKLVEVIGDKSIPTQLYVPDGQSLIREDGSINPLVTNKPGGKFQQAYVTAEDLQRSKKRWFDVNKSPAQLKFNAAMKELTKNVAGFGQVGATNPISSNEQEFDAFSFDKELEISRATPSPAGFRAAETHAWQPGMPYIGEAPSYEDAMHAAQISGTPINWQNVAEAEQAYLNRQAKPRQAVQKPLSMQEQADLASQEARAAVRSGYRNQLASQAPASWSDAMENELTNAVLPADGTPTDWQKAQEEAWFNHQYNQQVEQEGYAGTLTPRQPNTGNAPDTFYKDSNHHVPVQPGTEFASPLLIQVHDAEVAEAAARQRQYNAMVDDGSKVVRGNKAAAPSQLQIETPSWQPDLVDDTPGWGGSEVATYGLKLRNDFTGTVSFKQLPPKMMNGQTVWSTLRDDVEAMAAEHPPVDIIDRAESVLSDMVLNGENEGPMPQLFWRGRPVNNRDKDGNLIGRDIVTSVAPGSQLVEDLGHGYYLAVPSREAREDLETKEQYRTAGAVDEANEQAYFETVDGIKRQFAGDEKVIYSVEATREASFKGSLAPKYNERFNERHADNPEFLERQTNSFTASAKRRDRYYRQIGYKRKRKEKNYKGRDHYKNTIVDENGNVVQLSDVKPNIVSDTGNYAAANVTSYEPAMPAEEDGYWASIMGGEQAAAPSEDSEGWVSEEEIEATGANVNYDAGDGGPTSFTPVSDAGNIPASGGAGGGEPPEGPPPPTDDDFAGLPGDDHYDPAMAARDRLLANDKFMKGYQPFIGGGKPMAEKFNAWLDSIGAREDWNTMIQQRQVWMGMVNSNPAWKRAYETAQKVKTQLQGSNTQASAATTRRAAAPGATIQATAAQQAAVVVRSNPEFMQNHLRRAADATAEQKAGYKEYLAANDPEGQLKNALATLANEAKQAKTAKRPAVIDGLIDEANQLRSNASSQAAPPPAAQEQAMPKDQAAVTQPSGSGDEEEAIQAAVTRQASTPAARPVRRVSPQAARLARENGIDPDAIPGQRVGVADVRRMIASQPTNTGSFANAEPNEQRTNDEQTNEPVSDAGNQGPVQGPQTREEYINGLIERWDTDHPLDGTRTAAQRDAVHARIRQNPEAFEQSANAQQSVDDNLSEAQRAARQASVQQTVADHEAVRQRQAAQNTPAPPANRNTNTNHEPTQEEIDAAFAGAGNFENGHTVLDPEDAGQADDRYARVRRVSMNRTQASAFASRAGAHANTSYTKAFNPGEINNVYGQYQPIDPGNPNAGGQWRSMTSHEVTISQQTAQEGTAIFQRAYTSAIQEGFEGMSPIEATNTLYRRVQQGIAKIVDETVKRMEDSGEADHNTAQSYGQKLRTVANGVAYKAATDVRDEEGLPRKNDVNWAARRLKGTEFDDLYESNEEFRNRINRDFGGREKARSGPLETAIVGDEAFQFGGEQDGGRAGRWARQGSIYQTAFGHLMMAQFMGQMAWKSTGGLVMQNASDWAVGQYGNVAFENFGEGTPTGATMFEARQSIARERFGDLAYQQYGGFVNGAYLASNNETLGRVTNDLKVAGGVGITAGLSTWALGSFLGSSALEGTALAAGAALAPIAPWVGLGAAAAIGIPSLLGTAYNTATGQDSYDGWSWNNFMGGSAMVNAVNNAKESGFQENKTPVWETVGLRMKASFGVGSAQEELSQKLFGMSSVDFMSQYEARTGGDVEWAQVRFEGRDEKSKNLRDMVDPLAASTGIKPDQIKADLTSLQSSLGDVTVQKNKDTAIRLLNASADISFSRDQAMGVVGTIAGERGVVEGSQEWSDLTNQFSDVAEKEGVSGIGKWLLKSAADARKYSQWTEYLQGGAAEAYSLYNQLGGTNVAQTQAIQSTLAQVQMTGAVLTPEMAQSLAASSMNLAPFRASEVSGMAYQFTQMGIGGGFENNFTSLANAAVAGQYGYSLSDIGNFASGTIGMSAGNTTDTMALIRGVASGNAYALSDYGRMANIGVLQSLDVNGLQSGLQDMSGFLAYSRQKLGFDSTFSNSEVLAGLGLTFGSTNGSALVNGGIWGYQQSYTDQMNGFQAQQLDMQFAQLAQNKQYMYSSWGLQDQQNAVEWQSQLSNFQYQNKSFELQHQFQQEDASDQKARMELSNSNTLWNMSFNYQTSLMQRDWSRQDYQYNTQMRTLSYDWNMEDLNEQIRRSSGYERAQLIKQRDRATLSNNLQSGHAEEQEQRQEQLWKREDERYQKSLEFTEQMMQLDQDRFTRSQEQNEQLYQLQKEHMAEEQETAIKLHNIRMEMENLSRDREEQQLKQQEQSLNLQKQMQQVTNEYQNNMTKISHTQTEWEATLRKITSYQPAFSRLLQDFLSFLENTQNTQAPTMGSGGNTYR